MDNNLSFLSLGGIGEVTKNFYIYSYQNEILLIDCGLGFPDETMVGVDLLLPDITYLKTLLQKGKKITGMIITHGHEDHMGGLPFILPQLPQFPIYATSFSAALTNQKLHEFGILPVVKKTSFNQEITIGSFFSCTFIHVTHSVPDTAHIFIKTPVGNFYHGSDFKFDLTPFDKNKTDFQKIAQAGISGIRCLMSECLGAEKTDYTPSDQTLIDSFDAEMKQCKGKFVVTTYSSNISRINQIIAISEKYKKYVCFIGRSLINAKNTARQEGILKLSKEREIEINDVRKYNENDILLFIAGSQAQENSALTRIVAGEHRNIQLKKNDVVVFSADPIPGNEISVYTLINELARIGIKVIYSGISHKFHVSGHGSQQDLLLLMAFLKPQQVLPISGDYRHMVAYKKLANQYGFHTSDIIMTTSGQEIIFTKEKTTLGQKIPLRHVYVDEISGEEVEQFVLHDRQKISEEGIIAIITEVDSENRSLSRNPEVVARGLSPKETQEIQHMVQEVLRREFSQRKIINDWIYMRQRIREIVEKKIMQEFKRQPLILPVVIEV